MNKTWEGVICVEGAMTGDGRLMERGSLDWEGLLPITLRRVEEDTGSHNGARAVGRVLTIERQSNGNLWATGDFDSGGEHGIEAARMVGEGISNGISVDLDNVSFELRVAADLLKEVDALMAGDDDYATTEEDAPEQKTDDEGRVTVWEGSPDDEVFVVTSARIRAITLVDVPAFAEARIELTGEAESTDDAEPALVASASRQRPPSEWFTDPGLTELTPLTVDDDGRVFGHLAAWDTCHTSFTPEGMCVQPPRSASGYSYFHVSGPIRTSDDREVGVGKIVVNTRHAGRRLNAVSSLAHYEDTGMTAAFVRAGEDRFGIWIAGMVNPDATPAQVRALRSSPLSGDWRNVGSTGLELVAALSVNTPGFPIPRPSGLVASGTVQSLVASGMVPPKRVAPPGSPNALSNDDLRYLKRLAQREREAETKNAADALAARVAALR